MGVGVFRTNHHNTRAKDRKVLVRFGQWFVNAARCKVDFVGGAANAGTHRYKPSQFYHAPSSSSLSIMAARAVNAANAAIQPNTNGYKPTVSVQIVNSNTTKELLNIRETHGFGRWKRKRRRSMTA